MCNWLVVTCCIVVTMVIAGIQVTHGISWHGMAVNCSVDLSYYQHINACGLSMKGTTSFTQLLGKPGKYVLYVGKLMAKLAKRNYMAIWNFHQSNVSF